MSKNSILKELKGLRETALAGALKASLKDPAACGQFSGAEAAYAHAISLVSRLKDNGSAVTVEPKGPDRRPNIFTGKVRK